MSFINNIQPLVKNSPLKKKADYSLSLLRLIILAVTAIVILGVFSIPEKPEDWAKMGPGIAVFLVILLLVFSIRKVDEWERAIVLRFGKFLKVRGPGLFPLLPVADRIAHS